MTAKTSASVKTKKKNATANKATAKKTPARLASKPKKKAAAAPKAKAKAKKAAAAPRTKTKTKTKALVAKKRTARPRSEASKVPSARPSDRAMAVVAQPPQERALTDEEREAMAKCAQTAHAVLAALAGEGDDDDDDVPEAIVSSIGGFVDDIRMGRRPEPSSQDIRLGLGVLWGEQVRAQVGWRWVHLSYPNGFASYAVVPDDRAFACFPLNRLTELMRSGAGMMNTSVPLFDSIRIGALPARRENAYLVIG
jgi:hypothetical protein